MNKQTIIDIYKLSESLYGKDRFKLVIETIKSMEQKGDVDPNEIPEICMWFDSDDEMNDCRQCALDFYIMNCSVAPMLFDSYGICISDYLLPQKDEETTNHLHQILKRINIFSETSMATDEINKKYDTDLMTFFNRERLNKCKNALATIKEDLLLRLQIQGIENMDNAEKDSQWAKDLIANIFRNFHWAAMLPE